MSLNPRVDLVLKKFFSAHECKELLLDFINSIVSETDQIEMLEVKNPYNQKSPRNENSSLNILAQNFKQKYLNIKIQLFSSEYYAQRALYHWAKLYTEELIPRHNYQNLKKTIEINLLNFNYLNEPTYHNIYQLLHTKSSQTLFDHLELHFIELEKCEDKTTTSLDCWINFLKKAELGEQHQLLKKLLEIPNFKKAFEILESLSLDTEERLKYETELKSLHDEELIIKSAEKKGEEKSRLEIAKNLFELGVELEIITRATGLPLEQLKKLQKK